MIDEQICLQNLKRIVSEMGAEQQVDDYPLNQLQSIYQKIADESFRISVMNGTRFKSMLWHLDSLRPEIKSRFKNQLFEKWQFICLEMVDKDQPEDRIETDGTDMDVKTGKMDYTTSGKTSDVRKADVPKTDQADIPAPAVETAAIESRPPVRSLGLSGHGRKSDWFDKLLDFVAAIVGH